MAEGDDSSQEKTEEPTPRKIQKAKEDGQIPRSRELTTTAMLMAAAAGFIMSGEALVDALMRILTFSFVLDREIIYDPTQMLGYLGAAGAEAMVALIPMMAILLVAALVGPTAIGGMLFSSKALAPKFSRINPISGIKRMFSMNSLMELLKGIGKTLVIGGTGWLLLNQVALELVAMERESVRASMEHAVTILSWCFLGLSSSMILIAAMDVPFQIYDNKKKLKMTMQEIKDEFKETEGKPEVKRRIKEVQYEISRRSMLKQVPEADVVITNPTHYSVALKYDSRTMDAPVVVAKGADFMALKIREIAKAHDVEMIEAPPLTRAIYYNTEVEEPIPAGLYMAVAQILAYVFQLRRYRRGYGSRPGSLPDFDIPSNLRREP